MLVLLTIEVAEPSWHGTFFDLSCQSRPVNDNLLVIAQVHVQPCHMRVVVSSTSIRSY